MVSVWAGHGPLSLTLLPRSNLPWETSMDLPISLVNANQDNSVNVSGANGG